MVWLWVLASAYAACDKELKALSAAEGPAVAGAFKTLAGCDAKAAGEAFAVAVKRTGDVESLAGLVRTAIDAGLTEQAHGALELVPDFPAREETARLIGGWCEEDAAIASFLTGLHDATKDRLFIGWSGALRTCRAPQLTERLEALAAAPPGQAFDDRYATVVDLYATKHKSAALGTLEKAAVAAAKGGPFSAIIDAMVKSVTPEGIGGKPSDADKASLVAALMRVSDNLEPDAVREITGALVGLGDTESAGKLLPKMYPDRLNDGVFLYGFASIERCNDKAMVHYVTIEDHGMHWSIDRAIEGKLPAFKHKLKCEAAPTTQVTPDPVEKSGDVAAWAESLAEGAKVKGYKTVVLQ